MDPMNLEAGNAVRDADMEKMMAIEAELSRPEPSHSRNNSSDSLELGVKRIRRVSLVVPPSPPAKDDEEPKMSLPSPPNPLRNNPVEELRPMTSSSKRLTFSTVATSRRPIKFGKGRYVMVELVPQPSDDVEDPLNWPVWKKELNYVALLVAVAMAGVMKTALFSFNSRLSISFSVSYTAVAALTGVPLMVSAITGLLSTIASKLWGKRPVYLASGLLMFIGAVWSMNTNKSFGQAMAARVFQGMGWGAFDTLILGSIHDTYFEHELRLRLGIYHVLAVFTTWGPPLVVGAYFDRAHGFQSQFDIAVYFFLTVGLALLVVGAPETAFDRSFYLINTPASSWSNKALPLRPRRSEKVEMAKAYLTEMKPWSYEGPILGSDVLLQVPRALVAPTTALLTVVTILPFCALWAMASSLSLLFSPLPFNLSSSATGQILAGPWLLASLAVAFFAFLPAWQRRFTPNFNNAALATGTTLTFVGLLSLGLYAEACMTPRPRPSTDGSPDPTPATFAYGDASSMSFPAVGLLLGLVALAAHTLDATARPLIRRSAMFTSANLAICLRSTDDMTAGVTVWRSLFVGVFVTAVPNAVWFWDGLKATCAGISVVQVIVVGAVGVVWWRYDEHVRRMDGRVMGCVHLDMVKRQGSFFDMD